MTSCRRGGGGVRVRMNNNVEGCMKKHDGGGGVKMTQNSMTSFMDDPFAETSTGFYGVWVFVRKYGYL